MDAKRRFSTFVQRMFAGCILFVLLALFVACTSSSENSSTPQQPTTASSSPSGASESGNDIVPTATAVIANQPELFEGVTLHMLVQKEIADMPIFLQYIADFEQRTKAQVHITTTTPDSQGQSLSNENGTGISNPIDSFSQAWNNHDDTISDTLATAYAYDVLVLEPQWITQEFVDGTFEDLSQRIESDRRLQWDDIAPAIRNEIALSQEHVFALPISTELFFVYYRQDVLHQAGLEPPQTWEDYIAIARHFHGQDLNGDGTGDFGSCISRHDGIYHVFWAIAGSFLQSRGSHQGIFFYRQTMEPLVNNTAFAAALDTLRAISTYGPPREIKLDRERVYTLMQEGRCALTIESTSASAQVLALAANRFAQMTGTAPLPGSPRVFDRAVSDIVACNAEICPHALAGVNITPYIAPGGWVGAINATSSAANKDASYALLSHLVQSVRTNFYAGVAMDMVPPYRTIAVTHTVGLESYGMSHQTAQSYMEAIGTSFHSDNMVLPLRVPFEHRYQSVVLNKALTEFLAGIIGRDQAMERIYTGWQRITDEVGRDNQRMYYTASLLGK